MIFTKKHGKYCMRFECVGMGVRVGVRVKVRVRVREEYRSAQIISC